MSVQSTGPVRSTDRRSLPRMEGVTARLYAKGRGSDSQLRTYRQQARELTDGLPDGADILEIAPGPGYLAVELARPGRFHVTGIDLSRTFVGIATEYARRQGVDVTFRQGDAESLPFPDASFDLTVCQAAFKNFGRPVAALDEMYRVLRPGRTAVIHDMSRESTPADIDAEVKGMGISRLNSVFVRRVLGLLRLRAASEVRWREFASLSSFGAAEISRHGITTEVRLTRPV
ncbi:MAG: class I SAM-dependent methyltransferase [Nocardiopsaceae bacterium]|nr:class I SAM-dependent methyltransferase [Nocardiopsaceae bacterium]